MTHRYEAVWLPLSKVELCTRRSVISRLNSDLITVCFTNTVSEYKMLSSGRAAARPQAWSRGRASCVRLLSPLSATLDTTSQRSFRQSCSRRSETPLAGEPLPYPLDQAQFEELRASLMARRLPMTLDAANSTPSTSLISTLSDFLPFLSPGKSGVIGGQVPFGHHLVYFPTQSKLSELLPDATEPLQSPGRPFDRRMWAGGT